MRRRLAELAEFDYDAQHVQGLVDEIATAQSESRLDLLVSELDHVIAEARAAAERDDAIERANAELESMSARMAEIHSRAADHLQVSIRALISERVAGVPSDIAAAVDAVVAETDRAADRRHVVDAMRRALEGLGYLVGPEFSTDLAGQAGTAFACNSTSGYGVKIRLEPDSNRFSAQPVKSDDIVTSAEEDVAAERQFCGAFDTLIDLAKADGVLLNADVTTAPGVCAVQQVAAGNLAASAGARRRVVERREMRQGR